MTDPSGYFSLKKFFKKLIKQIVVRTILAVADTFCGGCATMIYSAYQGYKNGGVVGLVASLTGFDTSPLGRMVVGCVSAASNGGSCGRGALAADARHWFGDSLPGQMLGGCVAARINGGSCSSGAENAYISVASQHVATELIKGYQELKREKTARDYSNSLAPAVGWCAATPWCAGAVLAGGIYAGNKASQGLRWVLTTSQSNSPEETNGNDAAAGGEVGGQPPVPGATGGERVGNGPRIWNAPGNPNDDFDDKFPEGSKVIDKGNGTRVGILPDGRRWVVRPGSSESSGDVPTIDQQNPRGKTLDKIRYPRN